MGEFFASIKAFLEKVNLITFLLALAVAIAVYQLLVRDWLWALFAFCISYAVFAGVHYLYNAYCLRVRAKAEDKRVREVNAVRMQAEKAKVQEEKEDPFKILLRTFQFLLQNSQYSENFRLISAKFAVCYGRCYFGTSTET